MSPLPHPLRLLASATVGRPIYIAYLKSKDALAYSDGAHVYIGLESSLTRQRQEILVQSLLVLGGSLQRKILMGLLGRPLLRQRYLFLEVERCSRKFSERLPSSFLQMLAPYQTGFVTENPEQSLTLAKSARVIPDSPEWFGTIQPLKLLRDQTAELGTPLDNAELSELEAALKKLQEDKQEEEEKEEVKDTFWQWLSSPLGKDGALSKILRDLLDMSSSPDGQSASSGAATSMEKVSSRVVSRLMDVANAVRSSADVIISAASIQAEVGAHVYPEWDHSKNLYKPNWVTVEEVDAYTETPQLDMAVIGKAGNTKYQRALSGLCFNYEHHKGQRFGDDIVLDRLVDLRTAIQSGSSGDSRIYQSSLKTRRDLGVQILLDASSSTLEPTSGNERVCDLQAAAAWQLCQAFSLLGDRVALHGFHSWGRSLLRLQRLKSFDERIGAQIEHRFNHLSIAGYTRCGAAIRHAVDQLKRLSGMPCQLLLVISDGYPYDDQYEGDYAAADTQKALEEARQKGVACVCISVGSDADNLRLKKIYGDANYLAVDKVEKLANKLRPVIDGAIAQSLRKS